MSEWKVGDRVQTDKNDVIRVGVITTVETAQEERIKHDYYDAARHSDKYMETVIKSINVKWDNGEEQQGLDQYDVYAEDSQMERAFRLSVDDAQKRIREKTQEAHKALQEAVKISEETGIPFSAGISPLGQSYIPNSLSEKFPGVERDFYSEVAGARGEYEGWQYSAVC